MTGGRAAVFFDLDGTLADVSEDVRGGSFEFTWYPNAAEAVRRVNQAGLCAIVVTNQGPIARGRFTLADFWTRMAMLERELHAHGASLDAIYCCPHRPRDGCDCRKPGTGLVDTACQRFAIDPRLSYVIGDSGDSDMLLAAAIGARAILVRTGQGEDSLAESRQSWASVEADHIADHVLDAVHWILSELASNHPSED